MPKTKSNENRQFSEKSVPKHAFRVELGQFKAGDRSDDVTPFSMLARSKKPVMHWYWGAIYHDFDGMQVADKIPVDYCHDDNEIMGFADKFKIGTDGLEINGSLVHHIEGDRVDTVTHKARNGVPYQASIDFRGDDVLAEQVNEGFSAQVNGETIEGPALIFRKWPLIGMAVCPHGRDKNTSTQFSEEDAEESCVLRIFTEGTMPKSKLTGKPEGKQPAQQQSNGNGATDSSDTAEGGNEPSGGQQSEPESDPESGPDADSQMSEEIDNPETPQQYKDKLKRFLAMFGAENGLKFFEEDLSYAEAHKRHNKILAKQLAQEQEKNKQLSGKLEAVKGGEEIPTQQSDSDAEQPEETGKFGAYGRGVGAFAAGMKLSSSK